MLAELTVATEMNVVFADVVLTCGGELVVALALVERSSGRAATVAFVNAGCHIRLAFHYASKISTKAKLSSPKVTTFHGTEMG